ncbi:MAG: tetrahydromethanopterin S-methyltransferase subunit A [Chloroflexi bacterium]|nr:tetrahydromethanopterin S-methyltransferase subunit A [Chloroflexota bacterium]
MLKVKPADGYPPEQGRYARGNDFSPVAVCVILDTFDFKIPMELTELVVAGMDSGAALAGTLQTENVGMEKMICNIVANPNIRYIVLCGRESVGHLPGESLLALKQNGVDENRQIIGTKAPTPYLYNLPPEMIERFSKQVIAVVNLLCKPGERDLEVPGLSPEIVERAVRSCYQEEPVEFMNYSLYDLGAYPEPPICHKMVWRVTEPGGLLGRAERSKVGALSLYKLLPRTNCKKCGLPTCFAFAFSLNQGKKSLEECLPLSQPEFSEDREALARLLE